MGIGAVYMLTGPGHAVRLAVSIWSLRKHFDGPITVYTTQTESHAIGERLAADYRLGVEHCTFTQAAVRKNSSFLTKLALLPHVPYATALFLDADTLVVGDVGPLMALTDADEFHATQFAQWQTTTRVIRRRIESWRALEQDRFPADWYRQIIDDALRLRPAINSGVFGFRPRAPILRLWNELTQIGRNMFICDEVALQIALHRFPHQVLDCRFNCSPIYFPDQPDPEDRANTGRNMLVTGRPGYEHFGCRPFKNASGRTSAASPNGARRAIDDCLLTWQVRRS